MRERGEGGGEGGREEREGRKEREGGGGGEGGREEGDSVLTTGVKTSRGSGVVNDDDITSDPRLTVSCNLPSLTTSTITLTPDTLLTEIT